MNQEPKPSKTKQIDKFKQAARDLQADESEARFDKKLKEIARHKPVDNRDKDSGD